MQNILVAVLVTIGLIFTVSGSLGLLRFQDSISRMQVSTRCAVIGLIFLLLGVFARHGVSATGIKALLCALFLTVTAPAAAHAVARAATVAKEKERV